ncbi:type II toxin-antitoxin system TacA family antitoxin [Azohydromonas lata]|uniref:type II toxin-antitoxin system TacA family antitoxin n=1 Tax=Azohydromonas lata TaxID=45677 RepID=UPI00083517FF|nr:DUF1778 domain-containing protein [Azohydromonas lata]
MPSASTTTINVRAPAEVRELIDRAAALSGKTRTDFMLEASSEKARQVLLDRTLFQLNEAQLQAFEALMDAPLKDNEAVRRLLSSRAPWEE